jgi:hypothetical protein
VAQASADATTAPARSLSTAQRQRAARALPAGRGPWAEGRRARPLHRERRARSDGRPRRCQSNRRRRVAQGLPCCPAQRASERGEGGGAAGRPVRTRRRPEVRPDRQQPAVRPEPRSRPAATWTCPRVGGRSGRPGVHRPDLLRGRRPPRASRGAPARPLLGLRRARHAQAPDRQRAAGGGAHAGERAARTADGGAGRLASQPGSAARRRRQRGDRGDPGDAYACDACAWASVTGSCEQISST